MSYEKHVILRTKVTAGLPAPTAKQFAGLLLGPHPRSGESMKQNLIHARLIRSEDV